jgi:hypothetical protein
MAHIVGESRQGPRGDTPMSDEERNKYTNLILLCKTHHKTVDDQKRTYSIPVLRQMKVDHEAWVEKTLRGQIAKPAPPLVTENIHSTVIPITHLPEAVFFAPCICGDSKEGEVKSQIKYPSDRNELVPFLLREHTLFAFHDLRRQDNPFSNVIDSRKAKKRRATEMWRDAEDRRRYVTLLNRSLYKYTARRGIRYDPDHYRYYFPVLEKGKEREVAYRPLNKKQEKRLVAWQPKNRATGEPKSFWWHLAAKLQFHQFADLQWCLSIRPERHLTKNGEEPLPAKRIGRRVTSLKARMYNDVYLAEVVFWRDYLSQGQPRFILNFGAQSAVIDVQLVTFNVHWAGIPGDTKPFKNQVYQEDLFTFSELDAAISGEQIDWNELEDETE